MLTEEHMACLFILPKGGYGLKIWVKFLEIRTMKFWNSLPEVGGKLTIFVTELGQFLNCRI